MDSPLENIASDLRHKGFDATFKKHFWENRIHVTLADYYIEIKRDTNWYYIEYKGFGQKVFASAKLRILNRSNHDIIQLIALVKSFSEYQAE